MQYVPFGDLGFNISRLGFGMMRLPKVTLPDGSTALDEARAFDRLPLSIQMDRPALILALHKWAGEWFDARITLERLGQPAPF